MKVKTRMMPAISRRKISPAASGVRVKPQFSHIRAVGETGLLQLGQVLCIYQPDGGVFRSGLLG